MSLHFGAPQPLAGGHNVDDFACGEAALDDWLRRRAFANQASGAGRTFVVVDQEGRVRGYSAMSAGAVSHQLATSTIRRNKPDPVPVLVLARLAVDLVGPADVWIDLRGRTGVWARPLRLGGETLRPTAAFDAIAAYVHVEAAQCTEDDASRHKFIGPA